jgi:hypothetical protein
MQFFRHRNLFSDEIRDELHKNGIKITEALLDAEQYRIKINTTMSDGKVVQLFEDLFPVALQVRMDREFGKTLIFDFAQKQPMFSKDNAAYGGIDFAQSNLDMQIKRDGAGVPLPVSQQDLENIRISGLVPIILSIQSAANTPLFN